jgi:hypothetical protein
VKLDRSAAKMPTLREGILMGAGSLKPLSNLRMVPGRRNQGSRKGGLGPQRWGNAA